MDISYLKPKALKFEWRPIGKIHLAESLDHLYVISPTEDPKIFVLDIRSLVSDDLSVCVGKGWKFELENHARVYNAKYIKDYLARAAKWIEDEN